MHKLSKAAGLLTSPGLAPLTPATAEVLNRLLLHGNLDNPEDDPLPPPEELDLDVFEHVLRKAARCSGTWCLGSRFEFWQVLLESEGATKALCRIGSLFALGQVLPCAAACLALARPVPL